MRVEGPRVYRSRQLWEGLGHDTFVRFIFYSRKVRMYVPSAENKYEVLTAYRIIQGGRHDASWCLGLSTRSTVPFSRAASVACLISTDKTCARITSDHLR